MKKIITSIIALLIFFGGAFLFANDDFRLDQLTQSRDELESSYGDLRYKTEDEILEIVYDIYQEDPELYTDESWQALMQKKNYALSLVSIPETFTVSDDDPQLIGSNPGERYYALNDYAITNISGPDQTDFNEVNPYEIEGGVVTFDQNYLKDLFGVEPDRDLLIMNLVTKSENKSIVHYLDITREEVENYD